ncbi:patatin-like phospholipase family protein [Rubeoparvulum massiliense]|uniref:patatin-like phospholipase family protein n=1 Tax=Rubeoparvulum massiliense TaxID=1631346 RepID=UPI00065DFC00|nr:patatin family protein [Rubeoparvulum massiliense]
MERQVGLVLEGGGMRGLYTAGVLDLFMDKDLYLPYVIGVSAGACQGVSYVAHQRGRNYQVNVGYIDRPGYVSYTNLFKGKELFDMDFIFNTVPKELSPLDGDALLKSKQRFLIGTTDCELASPIYWELNNPDHIGSYEDLITVIRASSSLPFVSKAVTYQGKLLLDGGICDPIPVRKALKDGNEKVVCILTRDQTYRKKPSRFSKMAKHFIKDEYKALLPIMKTRYQQYNETYDFIEDLEREGKAFVIRPKQPVEVSRTERNLAKLNALYQEGFHDAEEQYHRLIQWLS